MSFTASLPRVDARVGDRWHEVGVFGGACFRATCRAAGADWYCKPHHRYYCAGCAAEINEWRARKGETPSCFKHVWYHEPRKAAR